MRLADDSNFSSHGRTSTSTVDDALSGKAELASSAGETDNSDDEELPGPAGYVRPQQDGEESGEEYEDRNDGSFKGNSDEVDAEELARHPFKKAKLEGSIKSRAGSASRSSKSVKPRTQSIAKVKSKATSKGPISPTSLPPQSRKTSSATPTFQAPLGPDEEDLSTKPRCQRCRKSKKGCDRQRPCQRCKDAGIGVEGCVSEDEYNGRKGRYGRHMGVAVKKSIESLSGLATMQTSPNVNATPPDAFMAELSAAADNSKKRKR